jgi:hypothetical protein
MDVFDDEIIGGIIGAAILVWAMWGKEFWRRFLR